MSYGPSWSSDEPVLADLYAIGMPMAEIAERLGRTKGAVKLRVFTLGLQRDPARFEEYIPFVALDGEAWARIRTAPNYFVSARGRVLSLCRGARIMTPEIDKDGYPRACLRANGRTWHARVHRLVAEHHVHGQAPGLEVAHWDGDAANPDASNLRWATRRENAQDRLRHGTQRVGEAHPDAIHSNATILRFKTAIASGVSVAVAAQMLGVAPQTARAVSRGQSWRHVGAAS